MIFCSFLGNNNNNVGCDEIGGVERRRNSASNDRTSSPQNPPSSSSSAQLPKEFQQSNSEAIHLTIGLIELCEKRLNEKESERKTKEEKKEEEEDATEKRHESPEEQEVVVKQGDDGQEEEEEAEENENLDEVPLNLNRLTSGRNNSTNDLCESNISRDSAKTNENSNKIEAREGNPSEAECTGRTSKYNAGNSMHS